MKQILILTILMVSSSFSQQLLAQDDLFIRDYLERLENSKKYLLEIAEMMPEEKYDYKVTPDSKSFAENLMHIGYAADWHSQSLLGGREQRDNQIDETFWVYGKSKKEMIATIVQSFDKNAQLIKDFDTTALNDKLDYFGLNRSKRQILLLLADHISHHRGQMLVSLRLNGLTPPKYVLYQ